VAHLWLRRDELAARLDKSLLHPQSGESIEYVLDIGCWQQLDAKTTVIESDAHRAEYADTTKLS
jgi:hypothetical protein